MDFKSFIGAEVKEPEAIAMLEFFQAFEPSTDPKLWLTLIEEEYAEVLDAIEIYERLKADSADADELKKAKADLLKEVCDLRYVLVGLNAVMVPHFQHLFKEDHPAVVSLQKMDTAVTSLPDAMPVAFPMEVLIEGFFRVHASNMSKLDDDGNPIRREDGKIMKGPNYQAPNLEDLV